ncbi:MAG: RNA polymerase sigma factor [Gammaproteobacteria bacterium]
MEQSPSSSVDPVLVRRARSGEEAALAALYHSVATDVYTLVRRVTGSAELAEDVLHESFIDALTKLDDLRDDAAFAPWLKRIAVNRALSHLRSSWVSKRVDWTQDDFMRLPAPLEQACDSARLEAALDALPHAARVVVWLYDVEGYTHREIGELMGLSESFSKTRLARAHASLRAMLGDEEGVNGEESICIGALKTI